MASAKGTVGEWLAKKEAKARSKAKILTPKRRKFAREVVATGSLSEAYAKAYDVSPETKASSIQAEASRTSRIPEVRAEIERLFALNGLELNDVVNIHKRNMLQDTHLPTSQRAVGDYYELAGMKASTSTPSIAVSFNINKSSD